MCVLVPCIYINTAQVFIYDIKFKYISMDGVVTGSHFKVHNGFFKIILALN